MTRHNYSYDYLRALAAVMIVFCHIFTGFGIKSEIGFYLGGTFVDVFLLLSAYLMGLSSADKIISKPGQFLKKRTGRIIPTYYTYLSITLLIIVLFLGIDAISGKQAISHYLFLNWFWKSSRIVDAPLPNLGHLWFMSCILLGYISIVVWSQVLRRFPSLNSNKSWILFFAFWAIVSTLIILKVRIAVYPCTVFMAFVLLFFKGRVIMDYIRKLRPAILISLLVICNMGGVIYYLFGGYDYPSIMFWINLLNACLWIATAPMIFNSEKISKFVAFLSAISFEIYLIHHPFCLSAYSLAQYMPIWLAIICVFAIAIAGGWLLCITTSALLSIQRNILRKNQVA